MVNAHSTDVGSFENWATLAYDHPRVGRVRGKYFLGERLGLSAMEVSLNSLPAGVRMPFAHKHREHEELYVFLAGEGEMQVDDQLFRVGCGSAIAVRPDGVRTWRNTGNVPLVYLVIQASPREGLVRGIEDGVPAELPAR
jgi:mannose-6-phosphate isomerase-like protein (cupin superfamily)